MAAMPGFVRSCASMQSHPQHGRTNARRAVRWWLAKVLRGTVQSLTWFWPSVAAYWPRLSHTSALGFQVLRLQIMQKHNCFKTAVTPLHSPDGCFICGNLGGTVHLASKKRIPKQSKHRLLLGERHPSEAPRESFRQTAARCFSTDCCWSRRLLPRCRRSYLAAMLPSSSHTAAKRLQANTNPSHRR